MKTLKKHLYIITAALVFTSTACEKDFLDKENKKTYQEVPSGKPKNMQNREFYRPMPHYDRQVETNGLGLRNFIFHPLINRMRSSITKQKVMESRFIRIPTPLMNPRLQIFGILALPE